MTTDRGSEELRRAVEDFRVADLEFVRHNETDFEAFREHSKAVDERYAAAREAKEREAKRKNLARWQMLIPDRWRKATLRNFDGESSAPEAAKHMLRSRQRGFYIVGPHTSGKSYLAYGIIWEFVVRGKLKPSQIKVITEGDLLAMANGGFEGRDALEKIFDDRYKCYLFDSLGTRREYDDRRESPALTRLIEEAYNRSALFIATSHMDLELYETGLPEQAAAKLHHMVKDGVIYTGQALYGKSDERRNQTLDVELYNLKGKISFEESDSPKRKAKSNSGSGSQKSNSGSSWKDKARQSPKN